MEDELICGLTEVNQWLIDNAPEDVIAILDDDIHHFYYRMYDTVSLDDPEVVTAELERIGQLMADLKIGFGATDATIRPGTTTVSSPSRGAPGPSGGSTGRFSKRNATKSWSTTTTSTSYSRSSW